MKNILFTLVILMALIFTGMQSVNAQAHVYVPWSSSMCPDCPSPGDWVWRVDIAVVDTCGQNQIVYTDYQIVYPPDHDADFVLGAFCHDQNLNPCYMVVAEVKKL